MDEPPPPKPKRPRTPKPWDPLWDAVKEVCGADDRESTRNHIGKVAHDLYHCAPPYTPADVRRLPSVLAQQVWWRKEMVLSPQMIQKHIGLVRASKEVAPPPVEEYKSLDQLRREALRSRRGG